MTRTRVMVWCALMSVALISAHVGLGQIGVAEHEVVLLWPGGAPGAVGNQDADRPSLTLYVLPPSQPARSAVVVCPGGGYAMRSEERRVGKECRLTCRSRWSPYH